MTNQKQRQTYYAALDYGNKEFLLQPYEKGDSANIALRAIVRTKV